MLVWIQKHDYSYLELHLEDTEDAIDAFTEFDWGNELLRVTEEPGADCPPGFGVVRESGQILHIVPGVSGDCRVHFHYPEKKRFLMLFSGTVRTTLTRENVPLEESAQLIGEIFQSDLDPGYFGR